MSKRPRSEISVMPHHQVKIINWNAFGRDWSEWGQSQPRLADLGRIDYMSETQIWVGVKFIDLGKVDKSTFDFFSRPEFYPGTSTFALIRMTKVVRGFEQYLHILIPWDANGFSMFPDTLAKKLCFRNFLSTDAMRDKLAEYGIAAHNLVLSETVPMPTLRF